MSGTLVWLRSDLRLADNGALVDAARRGEPVVPIYIHDRESEAPWRPGAASRAWLHHTLASLDAELRERGSRLTLAVGEPADIALRVVRACGLDAVRWNRRHDPEGAACDARVRQTLADAGVDVAIHAGALLAEPETINTGKGDPYRVFTPFWKACLARPEPVRPAPAPDTLPRPRRWPAGAKLGALELLPRQGWAKDVLADWRPGRRGALEALDAFVDGAVGAYAEQRDRPADPGVSRLSPHLHFGELSPREVWHAVRRAGRPAGDPFLRQLVWRDFAHHLLHHYPHTTDAPMDRRFERFPWTRDADALSAWQRGCTGYPLVDAGMRELWRTGWMHNRVRMVVASFLVKHLLVHWLEGARWFWDTLVDADLANNTMGWQWTAGCGADAAPYFRIFNPVAQGERFDRAGRYVARWVPELAALDAKWIHRPWQAPAAVLGEARVRLGATYPTPIVDHAAARARALAALETIKR